MNQKLKKQFIKNLAVLFSAATLFTVANPQISYAMMGRNQNRLHVEQQPGESSEINEDQQDLNDQLLDLTFMEVWNECPSAKEKYENLIKNGAETNITDFDGSTPLHYAAKNNNVELCTLLLDNGANVNAADNTGQTPLHLAISSFEDIKDENTKNQNTILCNLLLNRGANVNAKDIYGVTPLQLAYKRQCDQNIINLLNKLNNNQCY